jgi:hypothetical protein
MFGGTIQRKMKTRQDDADETTQMRIHTKMMGLPFHASQISSILRMKL